MVRGDVTDEPHEIQHRRFAVRIEVTETRRLGDDVRQRDGEQE